MNDTIITLAPRRGPRNAADMHRAIAAATETDTDRVLWAWPVPELVIIRSATTPNWGLIHGATKATIHPAPTPTAGDRIHWALIANPTRRDGVGPRATGNYDRPGTGKRIAVPEADLPAWAAAKLATALDTKNITAKRLPTAHGESSNGGRITITRYAIAGDATVTDPAVLAALMRDGIGSGKAYGCGLLQVGAA